MKLRSHLWFLWIELSHIYHVRMAHIILPTAKTFLKVLFFCLDLPQTVRFAFQMQICQEAFETLSSLFILCYTSISLPNILHAARASKMRPPHCLYFSRKYFPGIPNMESTNLTHKLKNIFWPFFGKKWLRIVFEILLKSLNFNW